MMRRPLGTATLILAAIFVLAGCSSGRGPISGSAASPSSASGWLAVVTSSADPNELDRPRADIVAALGSNDPRVVVSPGACFTGIAERYAARYVLALTESSRELVDELARQAGTDLEWTGPVTSTCID